MQTVHTVGWELGWVRMARATVTYMEPHSSEVSFKLHLHVSHEDPPLHSFPVTITHVAMNITMQESNPPSTCVVNYVETNHLNIVTYCIQSLLLCISQ